MSVPAYEYELEVFPELEYEGEWEGELEGEFESEEFFRNLAAVAQRVSPLPGLSRVAQAAGRAALRGISGVGEAIGRVGQGVGEGVGRAAQGIGQGVGSAGRGIGQGVGSAYQGIGQGIGSAGLGIGQGIGSAYQGIGQGIGGAGQGLGQGIGMAGQGIGQGISQGGMYGVPQVWSGPGTWAQPPVDPYTCLRTIVQCAGALGGMMAMPQVQYEDEYESEANAIQQIRPAALMEHLAHAATEAESEAEAEAFIGALVPLAAQLIPRVAPAVMRAAPQLVRGLAGVTRALRRNPSTRHLVRTLPTIVQRTAANIARQADQGGSVTPQNAVRTLARQTARVISSPQQCVQAYQRSRSLDQQYHRAAAVANPRASSCPSCSKPGVGARGNRTPQRRQ